MQNISVRELTSEDCVQIEYLFSTDEILRKELNFKADDKPTVSEISEKYKKWCESKDAVAYSVLLNQKTTIGCICLSRINSSVEPARIAGWLGSKYRGLGYGKTAIDQIQKKTTEHGVTRLNTFPIVDTMIA